METLFKLDKNEKGFADVNQAKDFFQNELPNRENYFYNVNTIAQIESGETIYFALAGYIVAKGTFTGDIIHNEDRDKFKVGHKLENIEIIDSNEKINFNIINGRAINYLNDNKKIDEIKRVLKSTLDIYPDEVDDSYTEGTKIKVFVNKFERNKKARKACLEHYGYSCHTCTFDFLYKYGDIGKDSIHVHHIIPLSTVGKNYQVDPIKDLIPVCPNCHLILHKYNAPTVEELKAQLKLKT